MPLPPLDRLSRSASTGMLMGVANETRWLTLGRSILELEEAWQANDDEVRSVLIEMMDGDGLVFRYDARRDPGGPTTIVMSHREMNGLVMLVTIEPEYTMDTGPKAAKAMEIAARAQAELRLSDDEWIPFMTSLMLALNEVLRMLTDGPMQYIDQTPDADWENDEDPDEHTGIVDDMTIVIVCDQNAENCDIRVTKVADA